MERTATRCENRAVDLLVAAGTLWCLFGLVLFLPLVNAPPLFRRSAATLLTLQLFLLLASGYEVTAGYLLATRDLPLLTLTLIGGSVVHGLRVHRRYGSLPAGGRR
jgi:hypothetical protein